MTRLEYLTCRVMVSDTGREAPPEALEFCRRAGWDEGAVEGYKARFGHFGRHIHPLPDRFRRLHDGQRLPLGSQLWRVVVGSGHSPEHACLYNEGQGVLISGDQVLPRISSNVSVHPTEPDADPLSDWLSSLERIRREVAADVLVLPAHNEPFKGLHQRIDALARGQEVALQRLRRTLAEPRRVVDVFGALFARKVEPSQVSLLGLATGEALACLNHLMHRGEVERTLADDGAWRYRLR
jgi:glyoxylase-like metal-dependent hydrolase (beta-lactamase superfamily II)